VGLFQYILLKRRLRERNTGYAEWAVRVLMRCFHLSRPSLISTAGIGGGEGEGKGEEDTVNVDKYNGKHSIIASQQDCIILK
jgi:hypothetical protein